MPTVANIGPHRFFFWSNEGIEPPHVHVERDASLAKFWLDPVALGDNKGFKDRELRDIEEVVREHQDEWRQRWNEYFGRTGQSN